MSRWQWCDVSSPGGAAPTARRGGSHCAQAAGLRKGVAGWRNKPRRKTAGASDAVGARPQTRLRARLSQAEAFPNKKTPAATKCRGLAEAGVGCVSGKPTWPRQRE
jgi:hypothetical protein